jgi:hypothetical protein
MPDALGFVCLPNGCNPSADAFCGMKAEEQLEWPTTANRLPSAHYNLLKYAAIHHALNTSPLRHHSAGVQAQDFFFFFKRCFGLFGGHFCERTAAANLCATTRKRGRMTLLR